MSSDLGHTIVFETMVSRPNEAHVVIAVVVLNISMPLPNPEGAVSTCVSGRVLLLPGMPHLSFTADANGAAPTDSWRGFFVQPLVNGRTVYWPLAGGATAAPLSTVLARLQDCMPAVYDQEGVCGDAR